MGTENISTPYDSECEIQQALLECAVRWFRNKNTFQIQIEYANYLTFTENNPEKAVEILEKVLTFTN